ncbi:hypothetical protein H6F61_23590 [Cyanobacteria bacterium FACHB-472]|nr:hypothetical protein [Cyanobacteria bacterium FACHB-472]
MKPSIAFIIFRMNCYRVMASAIDAALQRGWHVECWHDIGNPMPSRPLDFPTVANAPTFRNGKVTFREYRGAAELVKLLRQKSVDAVVNLTTPLSVSVVDFPDRAQRPLYVLLEPSPCDWIFSIKHPEELKQVDLFALTTPYWIEQAVQYLKELSPFPFTEEMEVEFRRKAISVGWPQIDQLSLINPASVRKKWKIPDGKPVVVYLNWPDHTDYGLRVEMFQATSFVKRAKVLVRYRRDWKNPLDVLRESHIRQVTKALRKFCDGNNAYLIVKYRNRDRQLLPEVQMADKVIFDESYYPHSISEVMSIAGLSISYFSLGIRDSVAAGVPHLAFDVAGMADLKARPQEKISYSRRYSKPGKLWNYDGVAYVIDTKQILKQLPEMFLSDFPLEQKASGDYYEKYLGLPSNNANVFLDVVQAKIKIDISLNSP